MRTLSRGFNLQKRVTVFFGRFAIFTKIKVFRNCAFITDSDNWVHFTAITNIILMNSLLFIDFFFFIILVFFNHFAHFFGHTFDFFFNKQLNLPFDILPLLFLYLLVFIVLLKLWLIDLWILKRLLIKDWLGLSQRLVINKWWVEILDRVYEEFNASLIWFCQIF